MKGVGTIPWLLIEHVITRVSGGAFIVHTFWIIRSLGCDLRHAPAAKRLSRKTFYIGWQYTMGRLQSWLLVTPLPVQVKQKPNKSHALWLLNLKHSKVHKIHTPNINILNLVLCLLNVPGLASFANQVLQMFSSHTEQSLPLANQNLCVNDVPKQSDDAPQVLFRYCAAQCANKEGRVLHVERA